MGKVDHIDNKSVYSWANIQQFSSSNPVEVNFLCKIVFLKKLNYVSAVLPS